MAKVDTILEEIKGAGRCWRRRIWLRRWKKRSVFPRQRPRLFQVAGGAAGGARLLRKRRREFTVVLTDVGGNKINVIKAVSRSHQPGLEGSQGFGGRRAEDRQRGREQGRSGVDQEEVRRRRRQSRNQVVALAAIRHG